MKTEWWFDDATFHDSGESKLVLARLRVGDDGRADVLTDGGDVRCFEDEQQASYWLVDEEYRRLDDLIEDGDQNGSPVHVDTQSLEMLPPEELARRLVITLGHPDQRPVR